VDAVKLWLKALDQRGDLKAQTRQFWRETARWTVLRELTDEERKDNPKLDVDSLLVKDFNAGRANQYITELAVKTPVQARSTHQLLTFTLRDAVLWGAIPTNPMLEFKAPKRPRRKPTRALTDAEYRDLLDAITYWRDGHAGEGGVQADKSFALYDLVVVLAGTGLRVNEALGLRLTDIDLASQPPTVTVAGTLVQIGGEPVTYQDGTKSHQGDNRTIAISDDAAAALTRQITLNAHPEYIFTTSTGNLISSRNMSRALRRARPERLDWVTFHTLRRTVATWIEETAGLEAASVQLGHSDPAITKTYYIDEKKGPIIDHSAILNRDERFASG
jgi:integrase